MPEKKRIPKQIQGVLEIYNSKRDKYGNCYWAFNYQDINAGKNIAGTISGGESNITAARMYIVDDETKEWIYYRTMECGIRDFNRMTKNWPYAGCAPVEIARYIKEKIEEE